MIRALALALAFSLLATATACSRDGGDPDRELQLTGRSHVLQLNGGTFTEKELRSLTQEAIADQNELFEIVCAALVGLTDDQAVEAQFIVQSRALPPAEQGLILDDEKRAIQILREECEAAGLS